MKIKKAILMLNVFFIICAIFFIQVSCASQVAQEEEIELGNNEVTKFDLGNKQFLEIGKTEDGDVYYNGVIKSNVLLKKIVKFAPEELYNKCVVQKVNIKSLINTKNTIMKDAAYDWMYDAVRDLYDVLTWRVYETIVHAAINVTASSDSYKKKYSYDKMLALAYCSDGTVQYRLRKRHKTLNPHWDNISSYSLEHGEYAFASYGIASGKKEIKSECYNNTGTFQHMVGMQGDVIASDWNGEDIDY